MQKGNAVYSATPTRNFLAADYPVWRPVAALDQYVGVTGQDQIERCVFIKQHYQIDRIERRKHCHAVIFMVYRPIIALALALYRSITVYAKNKRCAQCASLCKVSDMAAMQYIKTAVGKDQRVRQRCSTLV